MLKVFDYQSAKNSIKGIFVQKKVQQDYPALQVHANGKFIFSSVKEKREFIHHLNQSENLAGYKKFGEWNGILLINDVLQKVILHYLHNVKPSVFHEALDFLQSTFSEQELMKVKKLLNDEFGIPLADEAITLQNMLLLWLLNDNPAFQQYRDIFDDVNFYIDTYYIELIEKLILFFDDQPVFGKEKLNLIKLLRKPAEVSPHSIQGQLEYIRNNWSEIIDDEFFLLLSTIDMIKEETSYAIPGKAEPETYNFSYDDNEPEQFSEDLDWMPKVVMIAKSTYVWLDQLSKKYKKDIHSLHEIPDEELNHLSSQGFTGLWLIGIWERSKASKRIKHINGNPDAIASAYAIYDYQIASDLGGDESFQKLKKNCWKHGIRLASDMVPNHTGIDSKWMKEHPDWFLQLPYSPYPNYTYSGENLSHDSSFEVQIEDHYFSKSDAAVTFRYYKDGQTRYIYHGNDGTSFPWNDTAQLNYLKPEVREFVIQQIIEVAKKTPIIRFDAAMTLAKKHYQRLWFPEPGSGGDIPTRAEHSLTKQEFHQLMPTEFWREVVDRIAQEAPDTLLLAEAFWMMEGYFVRTLGMHRVYNSAFMNMLKQEENTKYRNSIFNIIEFNPEILKRFVNFMSNPDEDTSIAQFGKDDKYFGVCILMCTMPGLPMFAHGQIEGFHERYGMEYSRAKWNEKVDEELVRRHQNEIFPLLKRRAIFSDVQNFYLFNFITESGNLNENVFAYCNDKFGQKSLVVYHNKFETTTGWIKWANTIHTKDEKVIWYEKSLGEVFNFHLDENYYVMYQDIIQKKWFIRNAKEFYEKGIYERLEAFKYRVYLDFYEVLDNKEKTYRKLASYLQGGGTDDINTALQKTYLIPVINAFHKVINPSILSKLIQLQSISTKEYELYLEDYLYPDLLDFYQEVKEYFRYDSEVEFFVKMIINDLKIWYEKVEVIFDKISLNTNLNKILLLWIMVSKIEEISDKKESLPLQKLYLWDEIDSICNNFNTIKASHLIQLAFFSTDLISKNSENLLKLFKQPFVEKLLQLNEYDGILWYQKETMEYILEFVKILTEINFILYEKDTKKWKTFEEFWNQINKTHNKSGCNYNKFLKEISSL